MTNFSGISIGRPRTKIGLAFHPLYGPTIGAPGITADTSGLVIKEMERPTVRQVRVSNPGRVAVLLVAGTVLKGGQQNRVVEHSVLVGPGETIDVPTACVEQGRWNGAAAFKSSDVLMPPDLRRLVGESIDQSRLNEATANRADQHTVWQMVSQRLADRGVQSASMDYLSAQQASPLSAADRKRIEKVVADGPRPGQVGLAVSNADGVLSVDIFATPELLAESWERLVRSAFEQADPTRRTDGSADAILKVIGTAGKAGTSPVWCVGQTRTNRFDGGKVVGAIVTYRGEFAHASFAPVAKAVTKKK